MNLKRLTANTIITKEGLEKEVSLAVQNGFAVDYEEEFKGQVCVGAPAFGKNASLVGSVWLVAPTRAGCPKKIS